MPTSTSTCDRRRAHVAFGNWFVSVLLRSPFHRVMSGSVDLVRYRGRRSGRQITTPTQYATHGDGIVILVARHESKTWWRNFVGERDVDLLISGVWRPMTARAVIGAEEPELAASLMESYLRRFRKARRMLGDLGPEAAARMAVLVQCRPRWLWSDRGLATIPLHAITGARLWTLAPAPVAGDAGG